MSRGRVLGCTEDVGQPDTGEWKMNWDGCERTNGAITVLG